MEKKWETLVVIVGAGPSGLATAACLSVKSIPYVILEKENVFAPLWKKKTYDRLHLHLAKEFCSLPLKKHAPNAPTYLSREQFIQYLDEYVSDFSIKPQFSCWVESASYNELEGKWRVRAKNVVTSEIEVYVSSFLVVATGENSKGFIPEMLGLKNFKGKVIHSSEYKVGVEYKSKQVLVVGCGNSGMEISYDLSNYGANTSIVVRSPFHVASREIVHLGMVLLKYMPVKVVDYLATLTIKIKFGDLAKYGIHRPKQGLFFLKATTGRSPVIDVGAIPYVRAGIIKVMPAITRINEDSVSFENGEEHNFDAIIFATGYKSMACDWLKDYKYVLNEDGMPKHHAPKHWKGEKGIYCAGLSRMGLYGVSTDAKAIANDIESNLPSKDLFEGPKSI